MRIGAARVVGLVGLAAYNWWVWVLLGTHLLTSPDVLFSDLEVAGRPDASLLSHIDVLAGVLVLGALLLRGRDGPLGGGREWWLLVVFAVAGIVGGFFPYLCAEGAVAACRSAEWHFQLPWRHYAHIVAGIVEFGSVSIAVLLTWWRWRERRDLASRLVRVIGGVLLVAYPSICVSYLADRWGAVVEPLFFVSFTATILVQLFADA